MRSVFVDSSAWIAFFSASDGQHRRAHEAFERVVNERRSLHTSSLVLAEVHRLVLFRSNPRIARTVLDRITTSTEVTLGHPSERHHVLALGFLSRLADQPITYTDAMSFAMMKAARTSIALSFDRHFAMAGFTMWPG